MTTDYVYAGFWRRVQAALLDLMVTVPSVAAVTLLVVLLGFEQDDRVVVVQWLSWPILAAYYIVGNGRGGTLGKRWLGLGVVTAAGDRPGLVRGVVRDSPILVFVLLGLLIQLSHLQGALWAILDQFGILLLLVDDLWMVWDPRKQTLHDKIAGTYVVDPRAGAVAGYRSSTTAHSARPRRRA